MYIEIFFTRNCLLSKSISLSFKLLTAQNIKEKKEKPNGEKTNIYSVKIAMIWHVIQSFTHIHWILFWQRSLLVLSFLASFSYCFKFSDGDCTLLSVWDGLALRPWLVKSWGNEGYTVRECQCYRHRLFSYGQTDSVTPVWTDGWWFNDRFKEKMKFIASLLPFFP